MITEQDADRLSGAVPLRELTCAHLAEVIRTAGEIELASNDSLMRGDDRESLYYLVEGRVQLRGRTRRPLEIAADSPRGNLPLFDEKGEYDHALPGVDSRVIRVDRALVQSLIDLQALDGSVASFSIAESELDDTESAILEDLYRRFQASDLQLPCMPEVVMQIRKCAEDPDVNIAMLARLAQADPVVSGGLIHAANTPGYSGGTRISNVRDAVSRLGLERTQGLVTAISMAEVFTTGSRFSRDCLQAHWQESIAVSAIACVLARRIGDLDPERALLAGLLHRIGTVPILTFIGALDDTPSPEFIQTAIDKLTGPIGVVVMSFWQMDEDIIAPAEHFNDWQRRHDGPIDYCDVVQVARVLRAGQENDDRLPSPARIPAFARLELTSEDDRTRLLEDAEAEIRGIRELLGS